jgi:hypothetical protein
MRSRRIHSPLYVNSVSPLLSVQLGLGFEIFSVRPVVDLCRNRVVLWLQRSQMFIETGCDQDPRSSGAQCFRQEQAGRDFVSLRWSEEDSLGARAFYKHYVPTGREPGLEKRFLRN